MPVIFSMKIFKIQSMKREKAKKNKKNLYILPELQVKFCFSVANNSSFNLFSLLEFFLTKNLLV